jgi:hypothetical protein
MKERTMRNRKGYRISGWSKLALVTAPFAIIAGVFVVAALENVGQADSLPHLLSKLVQQIVPSPSVEKVP